ncbi:MAG: O-antigen ligase family protein [Candidatus Omnitrophota bacterium]|jgi:O-antigen ligase
MKQKIIGVLDKAVEYSVYGMIFFIPVSIALLGIFAGSAVFFFLAKKILAPDFRSIKANRLLFILLLVFFIFMGLSLFSSGPLLGKSLRALLIKWGRFPLLLWLIIDTFREKKRIIRAACVLSFGAVLVGITAFTQRFLGFEFLRGRPLNAGIITGPFKNQNGLAAYLACVIPVALSFSLWKHKTVFVKWVLSLASVVLGMSLFWTFCRGGWLGAIAGVIFVILLANYQLLKKAFWPVFLFNYIVCIPLIGFCLFFYRSRGDANRFPLFHGAWKMIEESPFLGKGLGTFMNYCGQYTKGLSGYYVHNCFLQIWVESGVFSLLAFLLFAGYVFYRSFHSILKVPKSLDSFILIGLSGGLLSFLVHSFFDVHLYSFQLSFLFWIVLGLTVAATNANISRSE